MRFIGVEVEQEASAPPAKKNPGSAPGIWDFQNTVNQDGLLRKPKTGEAQPRRSRTAYEPCP